MAAAAVSTGHQSVNSVGATLNYYRLPSDGSVDPFYDGTVIETRRKDAQVPVQVTSLRGIEDQFHLDTQGFQVVKHRSVEKDFQDVERIKSVYYSECAELIKNVTGATRVHVMSHIVRRRSYETAMEDEKDLDDMAAVPQPSTGRLVHVDQSYRGARAILDLLLPDEAEKLSKTRWSFINLWRPIETVNREPLCLSDARSIPETDLQERELKINPKDAADEAEGEAAKFFMWSVKQPVVPDQHKWYYLPHMTPDEVFLFKIFDSKQDGRARRTPHTAFSSPGDFGPSRQSLEARCLVFWEDQACE